MKTVLATSDIHFTNGRRMPSNHSHRINFARKFASAYISRVSSIIKQQNDLPVSRCATSEQRQSSSVSLYWHHSPSTPQASPAFDPTYRTRSKSYAKRKQFLFGQQTVSAIFITCVLSFRKQFGRISNLTCAKLWVHF